MIADMELIGNNKVGLLEDHVDAVDLACNIARSRDEQEVDDAFMVVDLNHVFSRHQLWKEELPRVKPFYAVKCNTDPVLVRLLAALGVGFDCASKEEIDIVMKMGVDSSKIIYANPCKTRSFIAHAKSCNVAMMTFDNSEELEKIAKLHPNARMILRIAVSDPTATCPLNLKFGADPLTQAPALLKKARQLDINVVGISFHVGSGCNDASAYSLALSHARRLVDLGADLGFDMNLIDLGGGYPGAAHQMPFETIAAVIRDAIDMYFPEDHYDIIAEPGRFFASAPFSLVTNVIHAKQVPAETITKNVADIGKDGYMYYLNDGVYGSFNCILFDHVQPTGQPLFATPGEKFVSTIWGPTCDSLDKIEDLKQLPKLSVGDWVLFPNMGAYTTAASTTFNGFQRPTPIYVISRDKWEQIKDSAHV